MEPMRRMLGLVTVDKNVALFMDGAEDERNLYRAIVPKDSWVDMGKPLIVTLEIGLGHVAQDEDDWR